jgi:hypothetical protein
MPASAGNYHSPGSLYRPGKSVGARNQRKRQYAVRCTRLHNRCAAHLAVQTWRLASPPDFTRNGFDGVGEREYFCGVHGVPSLPVRELEVEHVPPKLVGVKPHRRVLLLREGVEPEPLYFGMRPTVGRRRASSGRPPTCVVVDALSPDTLEVRNLPTGATRAALDPVVALAQPKPDFRRT